MGIKSSLVFYLEKFLIRQVRRTYDFFQSKSDCSSIFDPDEGTMIQEPPKEGEGYWSGCPSVLYDNGCFYLYYRVRGKHRGGKCILTKSQDGIKFEKISDFDKRDLGAESVEGAMLEKEGGKFILYISYQDEETGRWKVGRTSSENFSDLELSKVEEINIEFNRKNHHLKDPVIQGSLFFVHSMSKRYFGSHTVELEDSGSSDKHIIVEIDPNGLKIDSFRISSVLEWKDKYLVFYDWTPTIFHTWEERSGLAVTEDFEEFEPIGSFRSKQGTKSLRYIEAVKVDNQIFLYYEISTEDGSHELRLNKIDLGEIERHINISS